MSLPLSYLRFVCCTTATAAALIPPTQSQSDYSEHPHHQSRFYRNHSHPLFSFTGIDANGQRSLCQCQTSDVDHTHKLSRTDQQPQNEEYTDHNLAVEAPPNSGHPTDDEHLENLLDQIRPAMIQLYSSFTESSLENVSFLGSGFIYDSEGFALTAGHLFETDNDPRNQLYFFARLSDGKWFKLELVGISHDADVAVLRLISRSVSSFPIVEFESTQSLPRQGQPVIAYGSTQYGDEPVATFGRVSQPQQSFKELKVGIKSRLIQIAMIAIPGYSGSPVFNKEGKVIAMIVKKFEEYALALPVSQIATVADSIIQHGSWSMPYVGLILKAQTDDLYDNLVGLLKGIEYPTVASLGVSPNSDLHVPSPSLRQAVPTENTSKSKTTLLTKQGYSVGITVDGIKSQSPAEKAGIRQHDIITHINGIHVTSHYQLFESIDIMNGRPVTLTILRGAKKFKVNVQPIVRHSDSSIA